MQSALKLAVVTMALLAPEADAHAHLSGVRASGGNASNRNKIRNGIVRAADGQIPGTEEGYQCDHCVLENTNKNGQTTGGWWSSNPGAHVSKGNVQPQVACMSRDAYGARGVLGIRAGENITTSTFVNADHGGFYRYDLSYNTNPSNGDFQQITGWWRISENNEGTGQGSRYVGWNEGDLQNYIQRMNCVGAGCTGNNNPNRDVSETWQFPGDARQGAAVMRWMWYSLETPQIYSHCVDLNIGGGGGGNPPPPPPPPPPPSGGCANLYDQCGGSGGTNPGSRSCCQGSCQVQNEYYHQCL
jgi:hypothetical protein